MGLEDEGEDAALLVGDGAEGYGAGDVGGAVEILCSAVEQQQSLGSQGNVGLGCGLVVDDGSMLLITGDGVERDAAEEGLLCPEGCEPLVGGDLGLSALCDGGFQPAEEFDHCDAVA